MRGHAVILAATLAWSISIKSAEAKLDILVDKATQRMLVIQDGYIRFMWPVSTGRDATQNPKRGLCSAAIGAQLVLHRVLQFADAFFDLLLQWLRDSRQLRDRSTWGPASHGCVRLHPHHAAILFDLVQQEGPSRTSIEITDQGRPAEPSLLSARWLRDQA